MKKAKYGIIVVIVVAIIAAFAAVAWYQNAIFSPASDSPDTLLLEVKDGDTIIDAVANLQANAAFKSLEAFRIYLRLNNVSLNLQKGTYQVAKNLNVPDLLALLAKGPQILSVKAVVKEGLRYDEIAEVIAKSYATLAKSAFNKADFLAIAENPDSYKFSTKVQAFLDATKPAGKSLEGYLFPDTYNLGADAEALDVMDLLISTRLDKMASQNISYTDTNRLGSFYGALTMASIIEREANDLTDMKMVSDILTRRYEQHIVLGADATLLYALKRWTPGPTQSELALDTPYNTRTHGGLPPTPIANPGIQPLIAVLNPTPNQYYYYITDRTGVMRYAVTFDQHLANIQRYGLSGE